MNLPDDSTPIDDRIAEHLRAYDEASAAGQLDSVLETDDLPGEVRAQLERARACIDLLNLAWHVNPDGGLDERSGAVMSQVSTVAAEPIFMDPARDTPWIANRMPGYEVYEEIGRGGMGVVYRGQQVSLGRMVAIKILPPWLASDAARVKRFQNEARLPANLTTANILPVIDAFKFEGIPVIVMPYVDGWDLGRVIADRRAVARGEGAARPPLHPWAKLDDSEYLRNVLDVLDRVVDALAALHDVEILHRDVKPSNILIDRRGNVWLSDFGLARLENTDSTLTLTNAQLGSAGYMCPEQWARRGEPDARIDVFGLGATIYHALTLRLPYGTGPITERQPLPRPPRKLQPALRADHDTVILAALEPDRENRYPSAHEFARDWRRVRDGLAPVIKPVGWSQRVGRAIRYHRFGLADVVLGLMLLAILSLAMWKGPSPASPGVAGRKVLVSTRPPKARVVLVPLDAETAEPDPARAIRPPRRQATPVTLDAVPPGDYLVVAEDPVTKAFHEVYRHVPKKGDHSPLHGAGQPYYYYNYDSFVERPDKTIVLPTILIPGGFDPSTMGRLEGDPAFLIGDAKLGNTPHPVAVDPFLLDPTEVSAARFKAVLGWLPEKLLEGDEPYDLDRPIVYVDHDDALFFAEKVGKRLPTEEEMEFAITFGGKRRFPWGESYDHLKDRNGNWTWWTGKAGLADPLDRLETQPPILGLFSNVAEWTCSRYKPYPPPVPGMPMLRPPFASASWMVRGGIGEITRGSLPSRHLSDNLVNPRVRQMEVGDTQAAGLGFRCARSLKPRFLDGP